MPHTFPSREALVAYAAEQFPQAAAVDARPSPIRGGRAAAAAQLARLDAGKYGRTRNFTDGAVSRLSPYIRHGVLSLPEVRDAALARTPQNQAYKFVNELAWRDYWQRAYDALGDGVWDDIEAYKTGFRASDYATTLPDDILAANTGVACIDAFIRDLYEHGWLHNHLRMYLAAYVVHWRRVAWQAGARWFLAHLLDGDPASNNLSWQWVASTFGAKPYIFNGENVAKYAVTYPACGKGSPFDAPYDRLTQQLFPNGQGSTGSDSRHKDALRSVRRVEQGRGGAPFRNPVVWVHGDCLSPHSEALTAYSGAPALWVWDDDLLNNVYGVALKRIVFLYECLAELPVTVQRGDVAAQLLAFAEQHSADGIVTMGSPSPRFKAIVRALAARLPVRVMPLPALVDDDGPYDLRRFSRYWDRAQRFAFEG